MTIDGAIASNQALGIVLVAFMAIVQLRNRSYVREITSDPDRGWRQISRFATLSVAVLIVWVSLFDNWRQLTAIPFRSTRQWESQRVQFDPPSDNIRAVTLALLAIALVLTACLFARHIGGYLLQIVLAVGAAFAWLPFFVIRQHFTLDLAMGFGGSWTSPTDVVSYVAFVALSSAFDIGLIAVSFAALVGLTAIPVTLVLDLLRLRHPRVTTEAQPFFNAIGGRTAR
jgi:hypothetical protein